MILPVDIQAAVVALWAANETIPTTVPGGLWLAGAIPSGAVAPYASFTVVESETEIGSNYTIRRFDLALTVWSDEAAEDAGTISRTVEGWFNVAPGDLSVNGGTVIRVRPGSADEEITPGARKANDITITRIRRRIVTEE